MKDKYLIFISHSSKDHWIAKQINSLILQNCQALGTNTFLDEKDIEGGDLISEMIREKIRKCDEFLVLLSKYSINRTWVLVEIGAAWVLGKRIIAITDKVSPDEMPEIITPYKAIDLNNFDDYIAQLTSRIKATGEQK